VTAPIPPDPLTFIIDCVRNGRIFWTHHITMRIAKRQLTRDAIAVGVDSYVLVKSYPNDKYMPSYLLLTFDPVGWIHARFATDVVGNNVRVVTAYRPYPAQWTDSFTRRITP
jgi:hypothetical protein